jgi:hypothetical protein
MLGSFQARWTRWWWRLRSLLSWLCATRERKQFCGGERGWQAFEAIERYLNSDNSDGLRIVPPTAPAVQAMVDASGLPQEAVLGTFAPRMAKATVRDMAINAVMGGCKPDYAPVLVAAVRAPTHQAFDMFGVANSTKGSVQS